jgi:hypothetical protein
LSCKFLGSYFCCADIFDPPTLKQNEVPHRACLQAA